MKTYKLKVLETESIRYAGGNIVRIQIENSAHLHTFLVPLLSQLGFDKESVLSVDTDLTQGEKYIFLYSKKIKVHLFIESLEVSLVIDSTLSQETLLNSVGRYFKIF